MGTSLKRWFGDLVAWKHKHLQLLHIFEVFNSFNFVAYQAEVLQLREVQILDLVDLIEPEVKFLQGFWHVVEVLNRLDFIVTKTQLSQVDQLSKNHVATVDQSQPNAHQLKVP